MKQLPEICRTGSNPCFLYVKPKEGLEYLNGGMPFTYVYVDGQPCICGVDNAVFDSTKGAIFAIMMNEGIHGDDPSAPLLRTGAWFKDEIHVGIALEDKWVELLPVGEIVDAMRNLIVDKMEALSFSMYQINVIEGAEIPELYMMPYLEWYYDQEPQLDNLEMPLEKFPDVGAEFEINYVFTPQYAASCAIKVAPGFASTIVYKADSTKLVVALGDIKKGEIGLIVEGTAFHGEPYAFYPKITFPAYIAEQYYPNITDSQAGTFLSKVHMIKTPGKVRFVWDRFPETDLNYGKYPETDITLFTKKVNAGDCPTIAAQSYRITNGKLDVTFDLPNPVDYYKVYVKNDFLFNKYFNTYTDIYYVEGGVNDINPINPIPPVKPPVSEIEYGTIVVDPSEIDYQNDHLAIVVFGKASTPTLQVYNKSSNKKLSVQIKDGVEKSTITVKGATIPPLGILPVKIAPSYLNRVPSWYVVYNFLETDPKIFGNIQFNVL